MSIFSRYNAVLENDGTEMTVRSALAQINEVLDELLSSQEGDFDSITRFALAWYRTHGYDSAPYGEAEDLARARGTAVSTMERSGILSARAGRVQLYRPADLPASYNVLTDPSVSLWEVLHHAIRVLNAQGALAAGSFLHTAAQRPDSEVNLDLTKKLAFLLFKVSDRNNRAKDALSFNEIASSWNELLESGQAAPPVSLSTSLALDLDQFDTSD